MSTPSVSLTDAHNLSSTKMALASGPAAFISSSFSFFPSSPRLNADVAQQRTRLCKKTNTAHPALGTTAGKKIKIVWKQKQTGRKKRRSETSAAACRGAFFVVFVFLLLVFRQRRFSILRSRRPQPRHITLTDSNAGRYFQEKKSPRRMRSTTVKVQPF